MKIGDVFRIGDVDDLSQLPGFNDLVDLLEEVSVTKHVTDHQQSSSFLCGLDNVQRFVEGGCDGFFEQHIIASTHGSNSGIMVHFILGCVEHCVSNFAGIEGILLTLELVFYWDAVCSGKFLAPGSFRFRNSHDLDLISGSEGEGFV